MANHKSPWWDHGPYPKGKSFGEMLDWHLTYWGTAPGCSLEHRNECQNMEYLAEKFHEGEPKAASPKNSETKLRNWRRGKHPPKSDRVVENIFRHLFGDDDRLAGWNGDLREALSKAREAKVDDDHNQPLGAADEAISEPAGAAKIDPDWTPQDTSPPDLESNDQLADQSLSWLQRHQRGVLVAMFLMLIGGLITFQFLRGSQSEIAPASAVADIEDVFETTDDLNANTASLGVAPTPDAESAPLTLIRNGSSLRPVSADSGSAELTRHFIGWIKPEIDRIAVGHSGPLIVQTTLDLGLQRVALDAVQSNLPNGVDGALISMEDDGSIRAMIGGTNSFANSNLAIDALREPGSAWRVFVYAEALERGVTASENYVDQPVEIDGWQVPTNRYFGEMNMRTAFAYSKNPVTMTVAINSGYSPEKGFPRIENLARRFGITTPISTEVSMPLGSNKVRMIEMTRAFAILSAGGKAVVPFGVMKISTVDGKVIYEKRVAPARSVVSSRVADSITDLLQSAAATGSARAAAIGRPLAGIAGTNLSATDGWYFGFSGGLTTGIWMGRPNGVAVDMSGGSIPARAFGAFMTVATKNRPARNFNSTVEYPELLPRR